MLGAAHAAARRPAHDVWPLRHQGLDTFDLDYKKPELAADRLAWRAMLHSGQPPPDYCAPLPTPAALPIALTRSKRPMAVTNAAIRNSMQQLAATTRLGVKKKIYPN